MLTLICKPDAVAAKGRSERENRVLTNSFQRGPFLLCVMRPIARPRQQDNKIRALAQFKRKKKKKSFELEVLQQQATYITKRWFNSWL